MSSRHVSLALLAVLTLSACAAPAPTIAADQLRYQASYHARLQPAAGSADVSLTVTQTHGALKELDFNVSGSQVSDVRGDGSIQAAGDRVRWKPPLTGGTLRYRVAVNRLRGERYDAVLTEWWGVLRLDRLFPPARATASSGTRATATLRVEGPPGWRFESPYGPSSEPLHRIRSGRLFPRPVGWAVAGEIGVRRDLIAGRQVAVAAPVGEGFRRQDTLAFLRWTLPALTDVFPDFPDRLLVVGSGRDMWRGGLSGPASLYVHPGRPLISGNGTSTLLHELVHVAMGTTPSTSDDWLVEGLAEYYSLELLRRTGGISPERFDRALAWLADWVAREDGALADPSTGPDTAFAALTLHDLASRLAARSASLDQVVAAMLRTGELTGSALTRELEAREIEPGPFEMRHRSEAMEATEATEATEES